MKLHSIFVNYLDLMNEGRHSHFGPSPQLFISAVLPTTHSLERQFRKIVLLQGERYCEANGASAYELLTYMGHSLDKTFYSEC